MFGDPALRTLLLFRLAGGLLHDSRGNRRPVRGRLGGGPIATGLVLASTVLATTIVTPLFTRFVRPAQRTGPHGPAGRAHLRTLVLTVLQPGLAVSLVIFSLSAAFGVYQIAANTAFVDQGAERTAGSGLRHRQHGRDGRPGGRLRSGRRRGRGDVPGGGHCHKRRYRRGCGHCPDAQVAPRVTTWRTACGGTAPRPRRGQEARCRYAGPHGSEGSRLKGGRGQVHVSRIANAPLGSADRMRSRSTQVQWARMSRLPPALDELMPQPPSASTLGNRGSSITI